MQVQRVVTGLRDKGLLIDPATLPEAVKGALVKTRNTAPTAYGRQIAQMFSEAQRENRLAQGAGTARSQLPQITSA